MQCVRFVPRIVREYFGDTLQRCNAFGSRVSIQKVVSGRKETLEAGSLLLTAEVQNGGAVVCNVPDLGLRRAPPGLG